MLQNFREKVKQLKKESLVLYLAYTDPSLATWKKIFVGLVIGYLFSPIDLIPDFIPIIGYIDDLLIVPLGIYISLKIIPPELLKEKRKILQEQEIQNIPVGKKTAILIIFLWIFGIVVSLLLLMKIFNL